MLKLFGTILVFYNTKIFTKLEAKPRTTKGPSKNNSVFSVIVARVVGKVEVFFPPSL